MQAIGRIFSRCWRTLCGLGLLALMSGCTTTGLILSAAGVATDTSMTWEIVKHVHARLTDGDPTPCIQLDTVQRAINVRCSPFVPGSVRTEDVEAARLQGCVLAVAVRDARAWPAVPELIEKGARPEACAQPPLLELAQLPGCPDFRQASPAVVQAFRRMAETDRRLVSHDVMRMLSCPSAVAVGLDGVFATWQARGDLDLGQVAFGPLGALHPAYLATPFAAMLEANGHTAREGLGSYDGVQPRGFELALRDSVWAALDWWLARAPELANRVPPVQGNQLPWVPLARVLQPHFLAYPASQPDMVRFLMARGADPWRKLPYDAGTSVVEYAREMHSPVLALLEPPALVPTATLVAGDTSTGAGQ